MSLYNLIPSCPYCNSRIKGRKEFKIKDNIHPYIYETQGDYFKFKVRLLSIDQYTVQTDVAIENPIKTKVERTLELFKTEMIYSFHAPFEVKDLIELHTKYRDDYINQLLIMFQGSSMSKKDALRYIFGVAPTTLLYPLNKLKRDTLKQLGVNI